MDDQLVGFEVAKLAKTLGFDECCEAVFFINSDDNSKIREVFNSEFWVGDETDDELIYRPTQSLLARWFRKVHVLDILVEKLIGGGSGFDEVYSCNVYRITGTEGDFNKQVRYVYDTYELALEAGLLEALKLIKINNNYEI